MSANGTFEVNMDPQEDAGFPAGRMLITKTYTGDMSGSGIGQMLSKRTEGGAAAYSAVEEFTGTLEGRTGGFTLIHTGYMSKDSQSLEVTILEGPGTDELQDNSGSMRIIQGDGHKYELTYDV